MADSLGPWATSMGPESRNQLDSFWRRRLKRLVAVSRGSYWMSGWMGGGLIFVALLVLLLPTIHGLGSAGVLAQDSVSQDESSKASQSESVAEAAKPKDRVEYFPRPSPKEQQILAALEQPAELEFVDTPLSEVVTWIAEQIGANVILDAKALSEEGLAPDEPITIMLKGIRLKNALRILLSPLGLEYVVADDVLKITTEIAAEDRFFTRAYPVGDLARSSDDLEGLRETIEATVPNASWEVVHGVGGTIVGVPASSSLVIKQTFRGHENVRELLANLRDAQQAEKVSSTVPRQP